MAAGDAQRAWFPEMMEKLKEAWGPQMSWEECADFCQKMTVFRESIWKDREIKPARSCAFHPHWPYPGSRGPWPLRCPCPNPAIPSVW